MEITLPLANMTLLKDSLHQVKLVYMISLLKIYSLGMPLSSSWLVETPMGFWLWF